MADEKKEKKVEKALPVVEPESVLRPGVPVSEDSLIHGRHPDDPQVA